MTNFNDNLIEYVNEKQFFETNRNNICDDLTSISKLWITDNKDDVYLFDSENNNRHSGLFMNNVILKLSLMHFYSIGSNESINNLIAQSDYYKEIEIYEKICFIAGISSQTLLCITNKDNKARNLMRERFFYLKKDKFFWDKLEKELDNFIKNKDSSLSQIYYDKVNNILHSALDYAIVIGNLDIDSYNKKFKNR